MKNIRVFFLSENFQFLEAKFSLYLNRRVFVMRDLAKAHISMQIHTTFKVRFDLFGYQYYVHQ